MSSGPQLSPMTVDKDGSVSQDSISRPSSPRPGGGIQAESVGDVMERAMTWEGTSCTQRDTKPPERDTLSSEQEDPDKQQQPRAVTGDKMYSTVCSSDPSGTDSKSLCVSSASAAGVDAPLGRPRPVIDDGHHGELAPEVCARSLSRLLETLL